MKPTLSQTLIATFVVTWTLGSMCGLDNTNNIQATTIATLCLAYLNNAHGLLWAKLRRAHG